MASSRIPDAELLRAKNLRATPQRLRLLSLLRAKQRPLAVVDIVSASRGAFDTATAYRMLSALEDAGLVRSLALGGGSSLYELAEAHHHHAVCTSCGRIADVSLCVPDGLDERVRKSAGFASVSRHSLEFYGLCRVCA
jgi:Fe2+ or Zn2+ uptake regulation protein